MELINKVPDSAEWFAPNASIPLKATYTSMSTIGANNAMIGVEVGDGSDVVMADVEDDGDMDNMGASTPVGNDGRVYNEKGSYGGLESQIH